MEASSSSRESERERARRAGATAARDAKLRPEWTGSDCVVAGTLAVSASKNEKLHVAREEGCGRGRGRGRGSNCGF